MATEALKHLLISSWQNLALLPAPSFYHLLCSQYYTEVKEHLCHGSERAFVFAILHGSERAFVFTILHGSERAAKNRAGLGTFVM